MTGKKFLLPLAGLALACLLLEAFLRVVPQQQIEVNNPFKYIRSRGSLQPGAPFNAYSEIYPQEFDVRGYYERGAYAVDYFTDQYGGRWSEAEERRLRPRTAVFLGDSFTFGFGLRFEDTYVRRLANFFSDWDFVNLAGLGFDAQRSWENYAAKNVPHRALLYGLHLNDLIEFPTSYVITSRWRGSFLVLHSRLADFIARRLDHVLLRGMRIREINSPDALEHPYFQANFAAIRRMREAAVQRGISFTVILLPLLVDLKRDSFRPVYSAVSERLRKEGISYVDLSAGWGGYEDKDLWITAFDQHPNEVANRILAERLVPSLARALSAGDGRSLRRPR